MLTPSAWAKVAWMSGVPGDSSPLRILLRNASYAYEWAVRGAATVIEPHRVVHCELHLPDDPDVIPEPGSGTITGFGPLIEYSIVNPLPAETAPGLKVGSEMVALASALLDSSTDQQRATLLLGWDDEDRTRWFTRRQTTVACR